MAKIKLKEIAFEVLCECGGKFLAEEFKPECPYCKKKYLIEIQSHKNRVKLSISEVKLSIYEKGQ